MIRFNQHALTYVCPYCGLTQAFAGSYASRETFYSERYIVDHDYETRFTIYTIKCTNEACKQICVIGINKQDGHQVDIMPQHVFRQFPKYIPQQIRADYEEASQIISLSPKAAATLLRRSLQGMIRDFLRVKKENLYAEINAIQGKVTPTQWKALDGLRKIGNIGAHMEQDVNLIIDIDTDEAKKLLRMIEMLLEKWYIARHDEEALCVDISEIADEKALQRKAK